MVEPISNTPNPSPREPSSNPTRPQASPTLPGAVNPSTNLTPEQRVEVLQEAVAKLIKKSMPPNSKLQIEQDKTSGTFIYRSIDPDTGEVLSQWPSEKMLELRDYLTQMEGVLVDKTV
jgi:flagellar protein FlaG